MGCTSFFAPPGSRMVMCFSFLRIFFGLYSRTLYAVSDWDFVLLMKCATVVVVVVLVVVVFWINLCTLATVQWSVFCWINLLSVPDSYYWRDDSNSARNACARTHARCSRFIEKKYEYLDSRTRNSKTTNQPPIDDRPRVWFCLQDLRSQKFPIFTQYHDQQTSPLV